MKLLTKWTCFLNKCFDLGEKTLSNAGGFAALVGVNAYITLLLVLAVIGSPEQLPGTWLETGNGLRKDGKNSAIQEGC